MSKRRYQLMTRLTNLVWNFAIVREWLWLCRLADRLNRR
jgi:hypothetical protein